MSSDTRPADQFALTVLIALVLGLLCAWCAGCAAASRPVIAPRGDVRLTVTPTFPLPGQAVRLACYVPEALGPGWIRVSLIGLRSSGPERIEHIQTFLTVPHIECGEWTADCSVWLATGERRRAQARVEVSCNF